MKSNFSYTTPTLHSECIEKAQFWLKYCNGSKKEAFLLLRHPYDFLEGDEDIKVLQTVLALDGDGLNAY